MIRPVTMNSRIPFKAKSFETSTDSGKTDFNEINNMAEALRKKSARDKLQNAFLIGTTVGALAGATSMNLYKDFQTNELLKEMAAEIAYGTESIDIKDMTKDNIPDVILIGSDGASTVYDMKNNDILINMDGELIRQDR